VIKDKTFFFVSWEQFRQRTVRSLRRPCLWPLSVRRLFGLLAPGPNQSQLYDPFTVIHRPGSESLMQNNQIPQAEWSKLERPCGICYFPVPNVPGAITIISRLHQFGWETTISFCRRADQEPRSEHADFRTLNSTAFWICRRSFWHRFVPRRCAENYHTKALAIDINHSFSPKRGRRSEPFW